MKNFEILIPGNLANVNSSGNMPGDTSIGAASFWFQVAITLFATGTLMYAIILYRQHKVVKRILLNCRKENTELKLQLLG